MALGVPKETSDKALEEAEDVVAPLVAAIAGIINDRLLLTDEYSDEDDAPIGPPTSPQPTQGFNCKTCCYNSRAFPL